MYKLLVFVGVKVVPCKYKLWMISDKISFTGNGVLSVQWSTGGVNLRLISGFHRAFSQSITFISRLMHPIMQNLEVKIYVV